MKKAARSFILIALLIACGVATTLVFLTIPEKRLESNVFWLAWSFAIPVNLVFAVALHLWSGHKGSEVIVQMPIAYYLTAIGGAIYLGVGLIFMYLPITKITFLLILEILITAAYVVVALFAMLGADYITKHENEIKKNVLSLGLLKSDVDNCVSLAKSIELKTALDALSENIRFSDPMTHAELENIENEIRNTVAMIASSIASQDEVAALELTKKADVLLQTRNSRCRLLK